MLDTTAAVVIRNEKDLKKFVNDHDGATPLDLVKAINISLELESSSEIAGKYHRLDAGRLLLECKKKVEADGENWKKWRKGKFDRSLRDIQRLMALASADDPEAAVEEERAEAKDSMAKTRSKNATNVCRDPVERILQLVRALTDEQRDELHIKLMEEWRWQE